MKPPHTPTTSLFPVCPGFHIKETVGALGRTRNAPQYVPAAARDMPGPWETPSPGTVTATTAPTYLGWPYPKCRLTCHGYRDFRAGPVQYEIRFGRAGALAGAKKGWWVLVTAHSQYPRILLSSTPLSSHCHLAFRYAVSPNSPR